MAKSLVLFVMSLFLFSAVSCAEAGNPPEEPAIPAVVYYFPEEPEILGTEGSEAEEPKYEESEPEESAGFPENPNTSEEYCRYYMYVYYMYVYYEHEEYSPGPRKLVALTFDDGPSNLTNRLLDILDEHGGHITLCVLGYRVVRWPEVILRAAEAGHDVIGHSWNHRDFTGLDENAIIMQILDTSAAIEAVTGFPPPPIFRAPYGALNTRVRRVARELGYSILNWSMDTLDWRDRDADIIHRTIMDGVKHGSIVLLHEVHATTIEAMERVIPELIEQGFTLVPITELLKYLYGEIEPGVEYRGVR